MRRGRGKRAEASIRGQDSCPTGDGKRAMLCQGQPGLSASQPVCIASQPESSARGSLQREAAASLEQPLAEGEGGWPNTPQTPPGLYCSFSLFLLGGGGELLNPPHEGLCTPCCSSCTDLKAGRPGSVRSSSSKIRGKARRPVTSDRRNSTPLPPSCNPPTENPPLWIHGPEDRARRAAWAGRGANEAEKQLPT